VNTVGVFVNERVPTILQIARRVGLTTLQLHGDEPSSTVRRLKPFKIIKAFRVGIGFRVRQAAVYPADALLFDTKIGHHYGGTGRTFDWKLLKKTSFKRPIIVSGGLNPANVKNVVRLLRPYGVDVSSGVESSPGVKDKRSVWEFIVNAKS